VTQLFDSLGCSGQEERPVAERRHRGFDDRRPTDRSRSQCGDRPSAAPATSPMPQSVSTDPPATATTVLTFDARQARAARTLGLDVLGV
jgi:hypothetical protein